MKTPCKFVWNGPPINLSNPNGEGTLGIIEQGHEGVLVYPGLASFSPDLALLYKVDAAHIDTDLPLTGGLGGWDGETVTPTLVKTLLELDSAIPTLIQVMNDNPDLGPKVVQGVMAGMS